MRALHLILFVAAIGADASAQDRASYEALRDLPVEEAMAKARQDGEAVPAEAIRYSVRKALADLMYPIDLRTPFEPLDTDDVVSSIRDFETKAGLVADGQHTFRESERLLRMAELSSLTPISVGMGNAVTVYEGVNPTIYASGTWAMPDIAWPLNRSEIQCSIDEGICTDRSVSLSAPRLSGSQADLSSYVVHTAVDHYEIQSWNGGILDASATSTCRRVRLSINTLTKLVSQTSEDLDPKGCQIAGTNQRLDPLVGLRVATLVDTYEAEQSYQSQLRSETDAVRGGAWQALRDKFKD